MTSMVLIVDIVSSVSSKLELLNELRWVNEGIHPFNIDPSYSGVLAFVSMIEKTREKEYQNSDELAFSVPYITSPSAILCLISHIANDRR